ncbi:MAG: PAS domain S-box protein [Azonexaceae bacterium]|nr:PAS domain S-box protein [Azonexaceae bacterium]
MNKSATADIYRLITEQMSDALIYSDRQGVICQWNRAAERLFGFERASALGQSLDLIIPEALREAHWAGFNRAMANGTMRLAGRATVTRALTAAGDTIYVEMSFAVICDEAANVIGSVAVARDATQRHLREKALRERLAESHKNDHHSG